MFKHKLSLQNIGSLFGNFDELSGAVFKSAKNATSVSDMQNYQVDWFNDLFKVNSNGLSEYTMEQIKAKASIVGLNESLSSQAIALAKDADFTAKATAGSITWGQALEDSSVNISEIGDALLRSNNVSDEAKNCLKTLGETVGKTSDNYKTAVNNIIDGSAGFGDISDTFIDLGTAAEQSTGKVKNTFKGLGATIKSFATSTAGITTIILGSMLAIGALVDQFDELSYTELQDKFEQSSSSYESAKSEVESVKSELESVNSQIDAINAKPLTLSSEAELAGLQAQKSELEQILTLKENIAEAAKNQSAYDALNASNAKTSATNTITAGTTDSSKTVLGLLDWYYGDSGFAKTLRLFNPASTENLVEQWNAFTDQDLLTLDSKKLSDFRKQEQELIDWFNSDEGQAATQKNTDVFKSKQEELQKITSGITELQTDIAEKQATISSQIEAMTDETTGEALPGFENRVASLRDTLNEISHLETIDMTDLEKSFNAIDKYFGQSSTSNLKSYFQELANEGKLTADAIEDIGISASTIGTDNLEDVVRYFNDMATAATEASTAIDGSFEGVQAAFESENQGAEWTAMADYVTQLQDLYESGKVGTDEFQSGVQYFMPKVIDEDAYKYDADAYVAAWESARKKIERYFDAENPLESMTNFTNDLIDAGKASQSGDDITWKFKTTAEAADALDLSVQSVEAAMHNLEDYGAEFDDVMFSGEGLERYESALENIKSLYDSMDEGESKDHLGGLIDNWDLELEKYQDDLSSLTEDQIVHIEFEYDLASIQQQIDQVMSLINNGDTSVENYAQVLAGNQQYIQTAESGVGFDTEGVKIPVEYVTNEDTISTLQEQLKSVTSEEEKIAIQAQIVNLQEVQKDLLNAFSDAHPKINAESSMDEINSAWNDFIASTEGQEIIANIVAKDDEAKQAVADLLGIDVDDINVPVKADTSEAKRDIDALVSEDGKTIVMDVNANTSDIEEALDNLQQGQTLYFTAKVDGKETGVAASFDETGEITYTANINDVEVSLDKVKDEEGNITYTADYDSAIDNLDIEATVDYLIGSQESPDTKEAFVDYIKNHQDDPEFRTALMNYLKAGQDDPDAKTALLDYIKNNQDNADDQNAIVNYFKGRQDNPDSPQSGIVNWGLGTVTWPTLSLTGIINWISGGGSRLSGTAHANGTAELFPIPSLSGRALAMGTLQDDSWLDPNWQTKHSEVALTGEEGQELVVTRANRWFTVGDHGAEFVNIPQGSIVFDAHQTKELLSKGRINSRGTAMIGGTAFANGWRLPSASSSSSSSSSSSKSSSSSNSSSSSKSSSSTSTKSAEKAADKFEEIVDSIEILLDRMDRTLQQLTDSIETYSYDLSKQSAMSDKAMSTIRSNLTTLQSAYNRYIKEANSVGLSSSWKKRVQNGAIDITTITDENLADQIKKYQEYYEKALDVQDTIADYQSQLLDLATEKLDNIEQYFENRTDYNDNFGYLTDLSTLQDAVNKLTSELNKQVANGVIKELSNEWFEAQQKISDAQDALLEATYKKYQDIIDNLDRISTTLDNSLELKEARGETITESDYRKQMDVDNKSIQQLYQKRQSLLKQQGIYDVGSAKYDDYAEQIADIDDEIYGLLGNIEDLKDSIWEVRWQPFFDGMEAAENLRNEMDQVRDLLDSDAFVDENGGLTSEGITNLGLISSAMNVEKQRVRDLNEAISKLSEDLDNGNISTSEYEEQLKDFTDQIYESTGVISDYQSEIIDLWQTQLEAENEVIQSSIDKHKELLQAKKDNDSYSRNVKDQTKEINQIRAQISALEGVQNESAKSELRRLQSQLAEAEQSLSDLQSDREYEVRQAGYDGLSEDLDQALEDSLNSVKYNADAQERVISEMLDHVVNNYADAYGKINQIIANTGIVPSDEFQQIINNIGTQSGTQSQVNASNTIAPNYTPSDFTNINTGAIQSSSSQSANDKVQAEIEKEPNTTNRKVAQITLSPTSLSLEEGKSATVKATIRPTDAKNKSVKWKSSNSSVASVSNGVVKANKAGNAQITCTAQDGSGISASVTVTVKAKPKATKPAASTSGGDGKPRVGDKVTFTGKYYYDSWGKVPAGSRYSGVKNGVVIDAYSAKKYGGNGNRTGGFDVHIRSADGKFGDLGWVKLSQISGYATGTKGITNSVEIARVDELGKELRIKRGGDIYEMFRYGDAVVPKHMTDNLFTLADHTNEVMDTINSVDRSGGDTTVTNNYESLLTVNGDVDREALPRLEEILKRACAYTAKEFKKDARYMGITRTL